MMWNSQAQLAQGKHSINICSFSCARGTAPSLRKRCVSKLTLLLTCFGGQYLCSHTVAGSVFCILFEDQKDSKISVGPNAGLSRREATQHDSCQEREKSLMAITRFLQKQLFPDSWYRSDCVAKPPERREPLPYFFPFSQLSVSKMLSVYAVLSSSLLNLVQLGFHPTTHPKLLHKGIQDLCWQSPSSIISPHPRDLSAAQR